MVAGICSGNSTALSACILFWRYLQLPLAMLQVVVAIFICAFHQYLGGIDTTISRIFFMAAFFVSVLTPPPPPLKPCVHSGSFREVSISITQTLHPSFSCRPCRVGSCLVNAPRATGFLNIIMCRDNRHSSPTRNSSRPFTVSPPSFKL